ncbi:MAG: class I mannose-6-phosphate isomerase [Cyclobacteriaceae bacterium]|nr:class I mannose-6-phosphate isomerase [Cyclobacteriaceae bacterium]
MLPLYPLLFKPILKEKIWGGKKLGEILGKPAHQTDLCGESWELSGVKGNISVVREGPLKGHSLSDLIEEYGASLLGEKVVQEYGHEFPLLVKFIDANQDLSIQVHPNDELAQARHNGRGKTEMWYLFQVDPEASLITGFSKPLNKDQYLQHLQTKSLDQILNREKVQAHDVFFIPAGRVHTIGKGILLAEIQQTSDITYRIYDFDRVDQQGNKRELHLEQALDAMDFNHYPQYKTSYEQSPNKLAPLVACPYFNVNRLFFNQTTTRDYRDLDSFVIYVCVEGALQVRWDEQHVTLKQGDTALIPALIKEVTLIPKSPYKVLEAYIA